MELDAVGIPTEVSADLPELVGISIILLLVATVVALITRRLRLPYVTGLVLAGLAITELLPQRVGLNSDLILNLFLPILVFEAAINTDVRQLRSTFGPIALLAGPGVLISSAVTAFLVASGLGLAWLPALFLGVILANTDTVSVIAVFKDVSVPRRLATIVEGESLFNDGVALVLFALLTQVVNTGSLTFLDGLQQFFWVVVGGTAVGLGLGFLSIALFRQAEDPLSTLLLTVAVALGAFQTGQFLGVSGAVAVVVAGLVVGNVGITRATSASTQVTLFSFWNYAGFGVNTFIFLLIGLEVDLITFWQRLPQILLMVVIYQVGRTLAVYPLLGILRWLERPIPLRWQHVLFFGNVKGSLSMAMALSLPAGLAQRESLVTLVFGAVLFSLVGQGLSLPWLVKRLHLSSISSTRAKVEEWQSQLIAAKAAQEELDSLLKVGILPKSIYEELRASYQARVAQAERSMRDLYSRRSDDLGTGEWEHLQVPAIRRRLLLAEKSAISEAVRKQILLEETGQRYIRALNEQLLQTGDE
ncbi:MAG: hypothetical protein OHK0012_28560 [Synechococcales cyanobacterium]